MFLCTFQIKPQNLISQNKSTWSSFEKHKGKCCSWSVIFFLYLTIKSKWGLHFFLLVWSNNFPLSGKFWTVSWTAKQQMWTVNLTKYWSDFQVWKLQLIPFPGSNTGFLVLKQKVPYCNMNVISSPCVTSSQVIL